MTPILIAFKSKIIASARGTDMAKEPKELQWIESLLPTEYFRRPMFGGFAYYFEGKLAMVTFESEGDRVYRGRTYDFDLWNGCLFPLEREHHAKAIDLAPYLRNHPVLGKWLYLPQHTEEFEDRVEFLLKKVFRSGSYWGIVAKQKDKKSKVTYEKIDTRRPRMFSDEINRVEIKEIKNISDLKNLGPASERQFLKAGIKTPQNFEKMGWKKALDKLVKVNPKNAHSIFGYALFGALCNKEWFRLSEDEKKAVRDYVVRLRKKAKARK